MYNHAAQVYNHTFFWNSMTPHQSEISPEVSASICSTWGSIDGFKKEFSAVAAGHFGSGWAWLVQDSESKKLSIMGTHDAVCPLSESNGKLIPLLCCDVWEHAYYLDYQNARPDYIKAWWNLVNWSWVHQNLVQ